MKQDRNIIVMGIDPGLRTTGYGVIEQEQDDVMILDAGTIRADVDLPLEQRLLQIDQDMEELLKEYTIDAIAVEQLYAHYSHPRTAILMGHARGIFLVAAARHDIPVHSFSATRIKKSITGTGRASKEQVQRAIAQQLKLAKPPSPADVSDALAAALCCLNERSLEEIIS